MWIYIQVQTKEKEQLGRRLSEMRFIINLNTMSGQLLNPLDEKISTIIYTNMEMEWTISASKTVCIRHLQHHKHCVIGAGLTDHFTCFSAQLPLR